MKAVAQNSETANTPRQRDSLFLAEMWASPEVIRLQELLDSQSNVRAHLFKPLAENLAAGIPDIVRNSRTNDSIGGNYGSNGTSEKITTEKKKSRRKH
ncbi:hypothetical protein DF182_10170 [Chitinophaga flava]|uniref:Uncharacterized protein n=2 Tax=Chitinophaga flava TaxID=2259036 RepID=A0A365Y2V7_9BACT|nr:hypothetical protein DF182_10170 [Chitinophaga flava]